MDVVLSLGKDRMERGPHSRYTSTKKVKPSGMNGYFDAKPRPALVDRGLFSTFLPRPLNLSRLVATSPAGNTLHYNLIH